MATERLEDRYAIVGMGGVFPDAPDLDAFWRNILEKRVSIRRFPPDSVLSRVFYRPEVLHRPSREDKTYTDLSGPIESLGFDPEEFRIPPAAARHMDPNQKLALLAARQALAGGALASVARERVSVLMGNTMIGPLHHDFVRRFGFERFAWHLREQEGLVEGLTQERRAALAEGIRERALAGTFGVTEDTAPGVLPNIIAARICSAFDLRGHAFVIDAACASALAAVACGIQQLRLGEADAVVCGAADMGNSEEGHIYFSGIGALSPDGSFPFDARASGFVIGQGGGVVVLKRLADAIAAGDRIYALLAGYGQGSDGKGKAIAAPNEVGQAEVIRRATEMAGHAPDTVELVEAHGTSTQVGDRTEVNGLKRAFAAMGAKGQGTCGIGSVKSNIGHLKSAAGIAGLLKAALALHHRWLPPTAGFERLSPSIELEGSPFYVLAEGKAWAAREHPRRAGVSAFGFGGANYHLALSEYREEDHRGRAHRAPAPAATAGAVAAGEDGALQEVALLRAAGPEELLADLAALQARLGDPALDVRAALAELQGRPGRAAAHRLAFTVRSRADLAAKLALVRGCGADPEALARLAPRGVFHGAGAPREPTELAFLFPGQGSQYPGMLAGLRARYAAARSVQARADRLWQALAGASISALVDEDGDGAAERLRQTAHTHPAMMMAGLAVHAVLEQMGLRPARLLGHSLGEFTALVAAGRLSLADGLALMRARGAALGDVPADRAGAMLALPVGAGEARALLDGLDGVLAVANLNGPRQTIVSGEEAALGRLAERAAAAGHRAVRVNVSRAFHSPLMAGAEAAFAPALERVAFRPSRALVLAASTGEYYGDAHADVVRTLAAQITRPVDFAGGVERLWADGARVFVEVGPSSILSGQAREVLADRPALVLASDAKQGDAAEAFLRLLCQLHAAGLPVEPDAAEVVEPSGSCFDRLSTSGIGAAAPPGLDTARPEPVEGRGRTRIVYSGVAAGLPGSFKDAFRDDNFDQLFEGRNLIERLTDPERQRLLDLRISKVVKSEQGAAIVELQSLAEVIQLAGKLGRLDLRAGYALEEKELLTMSSCVAHAVAAGYEALRDAQIPLVREYVRTASGRTLPDRWALPRDLQADTGVIFANGFPMVDPIIAEVSRHLAATLGDRNRDALREFYESLLPRVSHAESRRLLTDWFALHYARLGAAPAEAEVYRFNHQLMTQLSCQANNRLARAVGARGPNFQLNAACSSTCMAITLAEELIRGGRARRVIVIGADDPTSASSLPYLGGGFLATGAATSEADLHEAAVPFDRRRNGMIMGAGAVGLVVEAAEECARRGVAPVCELLGTHAFNTAGHPSSLDLPRYAEELERFVGRMEAEHGLSRAALAADLVYFSHEPCTPPRGGCAESEAAALRHVFGERARDIEVTNTKGMTGHTMGASIEDAVAARALQHGRVPPVVNHRVPDPALDGLRLSRGGARSFGHALRMAAGFGAQGNYLLLRKAAQGDARIVDAAAHRAWLSAASGLPDPRVVDLGRLRVVEDARPGAVVAERPAISAAAVGRPANARAAHGGGTGRPESSPPLVVIVSNHEREAVAPPPLAAAAVSERVLEVVAGITGYQRSVLELDMELEADLGVDTVKQATILATLAERLGVSSLGDVRLSDYPTLRGLVGLFTRGEAPAAPAPAPKKNGATAREAPVPSPPPAAPAAAPAGDDELSGIVRDVVARITGYQPSIIEPSMELEADLGVDTVKQATILAALAERFDVAPDTSFRIADFPTVGHLVAWLRVRAPAAAPAAPPAPAAPITPAPSAGGPAAAPAPPPAPRPTGILPRLVEVLVEHTPYPREMLEPDLTLESDLGLDAATREAVRGACVREFGLPSAWALSADARLDALAAAITEARAAEPARAAPEIGLARQVRILVPAPPSGTQEPLAGRRVWLWGDDAAFVEALRAALVGQAGELRTLVFPASGSPEEALAALAPLLREERPSIVVDATACGAGTPLLAAAPAEAAAAIARATDCRFVAWKELVEARRMPDRILAVTALDGAHGLSAGAGPMDPVFGLHAGFYKALRKEWPTRGVAVLDLAPEAARAPSAAALEPVLAELVERGPGVEICRVAGARHRVAVADAPIPDEAAGAGLAPDEVVVATGGGAGITAVILEHLARRGPCRVALVGRTALDAEARRFHALPPEARPAEKDAIRRHLAEAVQRVTPVMIEEAYAARVRASEILDTLARLEALGCRASYHAADVCDRAQLAAALDEVRRVHGPITTLLHGAGREVSRAMEKKSLDEFRAVHRVKTLGAIHLSDLCRADPLRRVVAISSIAGLVGSAAQVDYSAANAFLDAWVRACRRSRGIGGRSLVWSGWADRGMAWRNGFLREHAENAGLNFIPPEEGGRAAVRELLAPGDEVEVALHRGLGGLLDPELAAESLDLHPFVDWVGRRPGRLPEVHRRFSPGRDALLDQHRLGGTPLMPGVGFMELMAEAHELLTGEAAGPWLFRQLAFTDAFKLYRDGARDVVVRGAPAGGGEAGGAQRLQLEVWSPFPSPVDGAAEPRLYCTAAVSRERAAAPEEPPAAWDLGGSERTVYARLLPASDGPERSVVFGPIFNDARRSGHEEAALEVVHGASGIRTRVPLPRAQLSDARYPLARLRLNPAFLDAMHQAGAVHCLLRTGHIHLPVGADEFAVLAPPREEGWYEVVARVRDRSPEVVRYDIAMLREGGELCCLARNVAFRRIRQ